MVTKKTIIFRRPVSSAVRSVGTALLLMTSVGATAASPSTNTESRIVAETNGGVIVGMSHDGVSVFKGIPYAQPPLGELRWKPPLPANPQAFIDATSFGASCPQANELAVFTGPPSVEEDCLYLNVFTTELKNKGGEGKPVIVWFHGGGNTTGSASDYDGTLLAKGGDGTGSVVVTVNYRLGLLGFIAHPSLIEEGAPFANYGTLDQQAALRWVRDNIAYFGGDPSRVIIAGQSGGSVSVHANVVSPLSNGLIDGAIFQSAPAAGFVPLDQARERGEAFAEAAGCPGTGADAAACLRELSVARILQLQGTIKDNGPYLDPANQNVIVDGTVIPMQPLEAYFSGTFNKVPVLGGTTHDELTFVIGIQQYFSGPPPGTPITYSSGPPQHPLTEEEMNERVNLLYGPAAPVILAEYPLEAYDNTPFNAYNRLLADPIQCSANLAALKVISQQVPTWGYVFTYQDAPFVMPQMPGFRALAAHTIDIQFFFGDYHGGPLGVNLDQSTGMPRDLNPDEQQMSERLIGYWTNFAAYGDPNGQGSTVWPAFDAENPVFLEQDLDLSFVENAEFRARYKCDFWDSMVPGE